MPYTVQQLARLAGVTTRTLHHYDHIGLLKPAQIAPNGYRQYEIKELLRLQQILFFRELELPLEEIKRILDHPRFNPQTALQEHRQLLKLKRKRLDDLLITIDKTLNQLSQNTSMKDQELYSGFSKEEMEAYTQEAKQRWGEEVVNESVKRYEQLSSTQKQRMKEDGDRFMQEIVANMAHGASSFAVQRLIGQHYESLRFFYEPNLELYRNLGSMYVEDPRFAAYFQKFHPDLPQFMRDAMHVYCDKNAQA